MTDHMVMWLACGPMAHIPVTERACWVTGCATLYRIEAMRRLGHADRARLAVLITALISRLPRGMLRSGLYPAYAVDPAPLLQPPRRGGWDKESDAGNDSAPATSTQSGVAGPPDESGAGNGPAPGTSTQSGAAAPEEPPGGPPGKRQKLSDPPECYHLGELRPMEPPPRGPPDGEALPPGSLHNTSRYINDGRDLVISGRVWHLGRIAAHLGVPVRGPCWPFLLAACPDRNRPSRCQHWGQRNHESATSAAHRLELPPGTLFSRDFISDNTRFSRLATAQEKAGLRRSLESRRSGAGDLPADAPLTPLPQSSRALGQRHGCGRGRDGLQRPLTPTERYAGGGEPSSTDKDGPGSPASWRPPDATPSIYLGYKWLQPADLLQRDTVAGSAVAGRDERQRPMPPTERRAGGGELSGVDKGGPNCPGAEPSAASCGREERRCSQAAADELAASLAALPLEQPLLPDDVWGLIVGVLHSVLEPCPVVRLSSTCKALHALLPSPTRQQLRIDHERATALCLKIGLQSSKELREAMGVRLHHRNLTSGDLASLAALSLDLPVLDWLILHERIQNNYQQPDVVGKLLRLAEGLHEGALRALTMLCIEGVHVGNTGAFELADALDRGAMPQLKGLGLVQAAVSGTTLAILTPALRRRPALERLYLERNPITADGVEALVATTLPEHLRRADEAPTSSPREGFARLHTLYISGGHFIFSAGYDILVAALAGGALPALVRLKIEGFDEFAPRLGCGWRVAMAQEHYALWEITHPPPLGSRAPFVLDVPPHDPRRTAPATSF